MMIYKVYLCLFFHLGYLNHISVGKNVVEPNVNNNHIQETNQEPNKDYTVFQDENGGKVIGYLKHNPLLRLSLGTTNVTNSINFTLYTRELPDGWTINNVTELPNFYNVTKKTKFITHGWLANGTSAVCIDLKNGYLNKTDVNVIVLDWGSIAMNDIYIIPMYATSYVGEEYAKFINYLVEALGADPKDFHMLGHSLGAHVSGFAGRLINGTVARITGLDPALPGFDPSVVPGGRLKSSDADFVDIIHTCGGVLGILEPIGDVDFYPNRGIPPQPGCSLLDISCSHNRSWRYYYYSIINVDPFVSTKCELSLLIPPTNCTNETIAMGARAPTNASGVYYLKTTDAAPFVEVVPIPVGFEETTQVE